MELTRITWRLAGVLALAAALGACGDGAERPAQRPPPSAATDPTVRLQEFAVPDGSHPHDVAPAGDGTVWYTAQATGRLGRLDPETGRTTEIPLGEGSAPHRVIVGPDGAAWITDGGLNAIVRVDPATERFASFPLPTADGRVRQLLGRRGELWGAESAVDKLVVAHTS